MTLRNLSTFTESQDNSRLTQLCRLNEAVYVKHLMTPNLINALSLEHVHYMEAKGIK